MNTFQRNIIDFGKIDYFHTGKKINKVTVDIELKHDKEKDRITFSCSAMVWNKNHTDCVMGGQCLDDLLPYFKNNKTYKEIHRLWKAHHLNDFHAGTPKQEQALNERKLREGRLGRAYDYDENCKYLESIGLLEDNGYRYGTSWLYQPIPEKDLNSIKKLLQVKVGYVKHKDNELVK